MATFIANRYRPAGSNKDSIQVQTDTMLHGTYRNVTHALRMLGLISENEVAFERSKSPPTAPDDKTWKFEFDVNVIERD